jgi:selenobiotic family peptide radical SAM maturase
MAATKQHLERMYPSCHHILGPGKWQEITEKLPRDFSPDALHDVFTRVGDEFDFPAYLPDLARIEARIYDTFCRRDTFQFQTDKLCVNPSLSLTKVNWRNLPEIIHNQGKIDLEPKPGEDFVLTWQEPDKNRIIVRSAGQDGLLALKIVVENLDKREIARQQNTTLAALDSALDQAVRSGILLRPPSLLNRDRSIFAPDQEIPEKYLAAQVFTLQWHITQTCDLSCKHCYDRSARATVTLEEAIDVLDQFYDFCRERNVYGQVSFTGGNPLMHPRFLEIYQAAADRGFMTAILGNVTTPKILADICTVQKPEFFQVSLEGLKEHNDHIRGAGYFDRVIHFLDDLQAAGIYSMIMLTLTRNNMDQVLPLAELLRNKVDLFTFNRLSMVGEGAQLLTPGKEEYEVFLRAYLEAERENPAMALKDNLINITRLQDGKDIFGGCAGFGCGAAFNFVALLPDGEVDACRKFPSPIGNIYTQTLAEIYDSADADRYRAGPSACRGCKIRHVCGGCLAVIDSRGLDITADCDPCCFLEQKPTQ